ncbi:hypothetical protein [uncultured Treponema sp.]|uniref:hypothetical protein n=2 Tax=uncultured Treponema sp. TaxID=162155 RepID=UPI0026322911|nr:hypothetical protein [uncultured Treponema sp.]
MADEREIFVRKVDSNLEAKKFLKKFYSSVNNKYIIVNISSALDMTFKRIEEYDVGKSPVYAACSFVDKEHSACNGIVVYEKEFPEDNEKRLMSFSIWANGLNFTSHEFFYGDFVYIDGAETPEEALFKTIQINLCKGNEDDVEYTNNFVLNSKYDSSINLSEDRKNILKNNEINYELSENGIKATEILGYSDSGNISGVVYQIITGSDFGKKIAPNIRELKNDEKLLFEFRDWEKEGEWNPYDLSVQIVKEDGKGSFSRIPYQFKNEKSDFLVETESVKAFRKEIKKYINENKEKLLSDLEKKESLELFSRLATVLDEGTVYTASNKTLGEIQLRHGNKSTGLAHIINRRYEERVLNKAVQMQPEDAQKEITAICFLVADSLDKGAASQTPRGNWEIEKDGIQAVIDKDRNGKFVLTGFALNDKKEEAEKSISTVIGQYGYTPEFLEMYAQVGAVLSSYGHNTPQNQQKSNENPSQNLLEGCVKIEVNGKERECKNGVLEGFKNAVKLVDRLMDVNHQLADENEKLRNQIHNQNKNKKTDIER